MRRRSVALTLMLFCALPGLPSARAQDVEYGKTFVLFKGDTYTEKGPAATPGEGDGNSFAVGSSA